MNVNQSFKAGWNYGNKNKRELTNKEIQTLFPNANTDAFAQGMLDGILNDTFRLKK